MGSKSFEPYPQMGQVYLLPLWIINRIAFLTLLGTSCFNVLITDRGLLMSIP
jgi:hypothetical protein